MAEQQGGAQEQEHRHSHRRDPSEGGWDPSIVKAPDSHKAGSGKRHRRHRRRSTSAKVLRAVGIVLACVVAAAAAVALGFVIALYVTGSI